MAKSRETETIETKVDEVLAEADNVLAEADEVALAPTNVAIPIQGVEVKIPTSGAESDEKTVEMPVATGRFIIGLEGSTIPIERVTPAELLVLVILHFPGAKRFPVTKLTVIGSKQTTVSREYARLRMKYSVAKLKAIFGVSPKFPETFEKAMADGAAFVNDGSSLPGGAADELIRHNLGA
jgi:hypothetical protein